MVGRFAPTADVTHACREQPDEVVSPKLVAAVGSLTLITPR